jgi:hypothetical protein
MIHFLRFALLSTGVWLLALAATAKGPDRFWGIFAGDALLFWYVVSRPGGEREEGGA